MRRAHEALWGLSCVSDVTDAYDVLRGFCPSRPLHTAQRQAPTQPLLLSLLRTGGNSPPPKYKLMRSRAPGTLGAGRGRVCMEPALSTPTATSWPRDTPDFTISPLMAVNSLLTRWWPLMGVAMSLLSGSHPGQCQTRYGGPVRPQMSKQPLAWAPGDLGLVLPARHCPCKSSSSLTSAFSPVE